MVIISETQVKGAIWPFYGARGQKHWFENYLVGHNNLGAETEFGKK